MTIYHTHPSVEVTFLICYNFFLFYFQWWSVTTGHDANYFFEVSKSLEIRIKSIEKFSDPHPTRANMKHCFFLFFAEIFPIFMEHWILQTLNS